MKIKKFDMKDNLVTDINNHIGHVVYIASTNTGKSFHLNHLLASNVDKYTRIVYVTQPYGNEDIYKTFGKKNYKKIEIINIDGDDSEIIKILEKTFNFFNKTSNTAKNKQIRRALVLDDVVFSRQVSGSPIFRRMFRSIRHLNVQLFLTIQYGKGDLTTDIRNNSRYWFLFNNNVENMREYAMETIQNIIINSLLKKSNMNPSRYEEIKKKSKFYALKIYSHVYKKKFNYLFLDLQESIIMANEDIII
jgi:hypothetical protein